MGRKEVDGIGFDIGSDQRKEVLPASNDQRIAVDSDANGRGLLVQKDGTTSQMRLDICEVGWKDVDDVLVAFALATWIPHETIIVIFGGDVK
jgi:hypothetical protein